MFRVTQFKACDTPITARSVVWQPPARKQPSMPTEKVTYDTDIPGARTSELHPTDQDARHFVTRSLLAPWGPQEIILAGTLK